MNGSLKYKVCEFVGNFHELKIVHRYYVPVGITGSAGILPATFSIHRGALSDDPRTRLLPTAMGNFR
jgi:hypothetical protein